MKSRTELRGAILRMHEFGDTERKIAEALRISQSTVHDAISRGTIEDKKGRGRKKTARSKKNIQRVKGMIKRNPSTKANSSRKLAKKLGVSDFSARQILKKDLNLKPYKIQKRQKLNANARLKRLQRARALYRRFSRGRHRQIVFSDEKIFDIQQVGFGCFLRSLLVFFSRTTRRTTGFGPKKRRTPKNASWSAPRRPSR